MELNINQIIEEGIKLNNPLDWQIELSHKRLSICNVCEFNDEKLINNVLTSICGICECPLNKLSFFPEYSLCEKHKWKDCDNGYFDIKRDKSII
jgi:hypothetical protein